MLLEDLAPPILSVTANTNGTATAYTSSVHGMKSGDSVIINGVSPAGFNTNGGVAVTVTASNSFTYPCVNCPSQAGSGGFATKITGWEPGRTVEVTDTLPTPPVTYLYSGNQRIAKPKFTNQ